MPSSCRTFSTPGLLYWNSREVFTQKKERDNSPRFARFPRSGIKKLWKQELLGAGAGDDQYANRPRDFMISVQPMANIPVSPIPQEKPASRTGA